MGLHNRPQSPLQGDALLDGNRQMTKVWDLVLEQVQNIRIGSQLLPLGRRIRGPSQDGGEKGVRYGRPCPLESSERISSGCLKRNQTSPKTSQEAIPRESLGQ